MSNELVTECLKHKDNRNIQTRLDYMFLYRNETKAKVIRIMETWTNQKRAEWYKLYVESKERGVELPEEPPEEALWVTMSYGEFSIYAYGTMNHDNIKENVDELVEHEHLKRRPHPEVPYGPPQYLLDTALLQALLNEQEIPSLFEDIGKIKPPRKKHTPQEKYPQGRGKNTRGEVGKIPPPRGENTYPSNNTTKNLLESPKKEESNAPASLSFKEKVRQKLTDPELRAITEEMLASGNENETQYHIDIPAIGNDADGDEETPTVKAPVVKIGASHAIPANVHSGADCGDTANGDGLLMAGRPMGQAETPALFPAHPDVSLQPQASQIASQQAPGAGALPPSADPPVGGSHGNTSAQAPLQGDASERVLPPSSSSGDIATASVPRASGDTPPPQMALTPKAIKAQNETRAKELWAIIERERKTKYSRTQRELRENSQGMDCLLGDDISDETVIMGLKAMDPYQQRNFTVLKFYGWLPNLTAEVQEPPPRQNGKPEAPPALPRKNFTGMGQQLKTAQA